MFSGIYTEMPRQEYMYETRSGLKLIVLVEWDWVIRWPQLCSIKSWTSL